MGANSRLGAYSNKYGSNVSLFILKQMLTESIMHDCVVKLLKSNDEESFECLCKLLLTIGKDLDHAKAKV